MAEHNLTIKATLDTSSVQRELDQINRNVMTMNGATGVSGSTRNSGGIGNLNKISTSIDRLNRAIDKLSNQMTRMGQQAQDRGREVIARRGGVVNVGSPVAPVARGRGGPKTAIGQWVKANRFTRADAMPLFMAGAWGRQLGGSLEDLGMDTAGGAIGFLGDVASGAATGSIRGGAWGAAIGGMIAAFVSATEAVAKFELAIKKLQEGIEEERLGIQKTTDRYWQDRVSQNQSDRINEIINGDYGNFTKQEMLKKELPFINEAEDKYHDIAISSLKALQASEKELASLEARRKEYLELQGSTLVSRVAGRTLPGAEFANKIPDWMALSPSSGIGLWKRAFSSSEPIKDDMTLKKMEEELEIIKKRVKEQKETLHDATAVEKTWKDLRQTAENGIRKFKEADDKWMEKYEKEQKKNAEKMKKLTDRRSNLLLDIEDDYTQQGVDLLTSMGKAGKYMSAMEMASLN